jgi:hypothetical protein
MVTRGDGHCCQREGQGEGRVAEPDKRSPFFNQGKHRTSNVER